MTAHFLRALDCLRDCNMILIFSKQSCFVNSKLLIETQKLLSNETSSTSLEVT